MKKNKRQNNLENIIIVISVLLIFVSGVLIVSYVDQKQEIKQLKQANYEWCDIFVQQTKMAEWCIKELNESFKIENYPKCERLLD